MRGPSQSLKTGGWKEGKAEAEDMGSVLCAHSLGEGSPLRNTLVGLLHTSEQRVPQCSRTYTCHPGYPHKGTLV